MREEYLAQGFAHVDECADGTAYSRCLGLIDSLPYYREIKRKSYNLLSLSPGLSVLDVGCGVGDDVIRMADLVAPGGLAVGVDISARMIDEAMHNASDRTSARFCLADAHYLPFPDGCFARCRIDRSLQHIALPGDAVHEMARILRPGGVLLAYDNDWATFTLSGKDHATARIMADFWRDSFTNNRIGRFLEAHFLEAGLRDVAIFPAVSVITELDLADQVYNIRQTAERAVTAGLVPKQAAIDWLKDLDLESRSGSFFCSLSAFTVTGRKP